MLVHHPLRGGGLYELVDSRALVEEELPDVVDALSLEPAGIRRGEPLLDSGGVVAREITAQCFPQKQLPVSCLVEVPLGLGTRLILVQPHDLPDVPQLVPHGNLESEINEVVVKKWNARLKAVGHAQLVLHDQEAVKECLDLEV